MKHKRIETESLQKMAQELFSADYESHVEFFNIFMELVSNEIKKDSSSGKQQLSRLLELYLDNLIKVKKSSEDIARLCTPFNKKS